MARKLRQHPSKNLHLVNDNPHLSITGGRITLQLDILYLVNLLKA